MRYHEFRILHFDWGFELKAQILAISQVLWVNLWIYSHLASPWEGEICLQEALREKEQFYKGKDDPQIALTLRSLGNVMNEVGRHTKAM